MVFPLFTFINDFINTITFFLFNFLIKISENLGLKKSIENIILDKSIADKNHSIEKILRDYPNNRIQSLDWDTGDETDAADEILFDYRVNNDERRHDLSKNLAKSMRQIRGYQKLCHEVEARRLISFNKEIPEHKHLLLKLWKLLKPDVELEDYKTFQWGDIGFQGDDPATDFRGMGILGLDQLVFFAQYDVDNCKRVFSLSHHPLYEFPFAICGINITALVKDFLYGDYLKNHFYNVFRDSPPIDSFHQVYCRVFTLFSEFWEISEPETIIHFNYIKQKFQEALIIYLRLEHANLLNAKLSDIIILE